MNSQQITMIDGLDLILNHFKEGFPRTISTKIREGIQIPVYNKEEALARFKAANYLDCKISAYPKYVEWQGINRQAPNLIFIDLDLTRFNSKLELELGLNWTLQNIKNKLGGKPTVMWSGHGYHIYQPVEAFLLEDESEFSKFDQPSRRLIQFAEQHLSNKKSDPCHSFTMSFKNCMLRIPGSYNTKLKTYEEVRIIQKWDGLRPSIKPLLFDLYLYLQDLKLKKIQHHYHPFGELCKYWRTKK
jgi:hypothetical protein